MLRYRADLRTLAFVAFFYALLAFAWTVHPDSLWLRIPLILGVCVWSFFCAVIAHNTIHTPLFRSRTLNRLFQIVLSPAYGHPVASFVPGHNLSHHRYLQTRKDIMRTYRLRYRWNLLNQLLFMHTIAGRITRDEIEYARLMRRRRSGWFRQLVVEGIVFLAFMGVLFLLDWQKALQYAVLPHMYAAWGIVGINFVQHDGCDPKSPWNHSRNFVGKLVNWWTFNNGFHGIHHMHPSLHWSLLPQAHAAELSPHIHPALEQRALLPYLFRAYVYPGKRVTYDGQPVVLPPPDEDESWIPSSEDARIEPAGAAAVYEEA